MKITCSAWRILWKIVRTPRKEGEIRLEVDKLFWKSPALLEGSYEHWPISKVAVSVRFVWSFQFPTITRPVMNMWQRKAASPIGSKLAFRNLTNSYYWYKVKANNLSIQIAWTSGKLELSQTHLATPISKDSIQKSYNNLLNKYFIMSSIILLYKLKWKVSCLKLTFI